MARLLKIFSMLLLVLASLLVPINVVKADSYAIEQVDVCGSTVLEQGETGSKAIYVERGYKCPIEVWFNGLANQDDVKVKAWVGGYEYGDVRDVEGPFEVEPGVLYRKVLSLEFPEDMSASDDYTLHVELYDGDNKIENVYTLRVQETRHLLAIRDIIVRPSLEIEAGNPAFVTVRVENMGSRKEEDIRVQVSVPELGISVRDYIDELAADEDSDLYEDNEDEEDSLSSDELFIRIPEDAATGTYDMKVDVSYNRGHDVVTATEKINVKGTAKATTEGNQLVDIDVFSKQVNKGEEVAFRIMIANLGEKAVYSAEVSGDKLWASSRVEPGFLTLEKDETGELVVYLTANEDANVGMHSFTVKVKAGEKVVGEEKLSANVTEKSSENLKSWKDGLLISFLALVIVLVVLAVIIAFGKMRDEN